MTDDEMWTVQQVGLALNMGTKSIYTALHRRTLPQPAERRQGRLLWRPDQVRQMLYFRVLQTAVGAWAENAPEGVSEAAWGLAEAIMAEVRP